ncbi:hypothetical protein [Salinarimonas soli]|nr:hypothetical protein [Salinarimonas soli]
MDHDYEPDGVADETFDTDDAPVSERPAVVPFDPHFGAKVRDEDWNWA